MLFGVPELHVVPVLLATRIRVAQKEGGAGVAAQLPRLHLLPLCSRAQPCWYNGENGYTKKPCQLETLLDNYYRCAL